MLRSFLERAKYTCTLLSQSPYDLCFAALLLFLGDDSEPFISFLLLFVEIYVFPRSLPTFWKPSSFPLLQRFLFPLAPNTLHVKLLPRQTPHVQSFRYDRLRPSLALFTQDRQLYAQLPRALRSL